MKKISLRVLFLLPLLIVFSISCHDNNSDQAIISNNIIKIRPSMPDSIYDRLQDGDIIIRKGDGPLSYHLMNGTKEEYTHCGIIFKGKEKWRVIHSMGGEISKEEIDGVQTMDLDKFIQYSADSMLYICRPVFIDSAGTKIVDRANHYLDLQVPFDHRFSLLTKEKLYCSELLYHIFKDINNGENMFVVKKKHKSYMLMFSTFFKEENFSKIYNLKTDHCK
tara:strand:+ start:47 stop:709 length:663 start_codon:yes stop_codon:yes gene_type:complete